MQQGGSLRQVQCAQLGGAVRNWEKGGDSELFLTAPLGPHLPKFCWASCLQLEPPITPSPLHSLSAPTHTLPGSQFI